MLPQTRTESDPIGDVSHRWAVVLAGGDGTRLLPLTRTLSGDERPKQYCNVLGDESLLDQTLGRVSRTPAIVYSLLRLQKTDPSAVVGFFPSDHHFSDVDRASSLMGREGSRKIHELKGVKNEQRSYSEDTGYERIAPVS